MLQFLFTILSIVGDAPMLLEPIKDVTVVVPNDAILECDIDVGEPEAEIKWSVTFNLLLFLLLFLQCNFIVIGNIYLINVVISIVFIIISISIIITSFFFYRSLSSSI
jgi:hypothetical protein